jgi:hypothetical protein
MYGGVIEPDEIVKPDSASREDVVLQAAVNWLLKQAGCAKSSGNQIEQAH